MTEHERRQFEVCSQIGKDPLRAVSASYCAKTAALLLWLNYREWIIGAAVVLLTLISCELVSLPAVYVADNFITPLLRGI